ncbi:MAG: cofactor-independent phosphoglycerate mutase [Clostridiales Family XIII bacterium]|jgi:2,3-bisphosphoglycerate-independent phosphoglycerate mutase|nr:cofactor-independent phosphoglycerate mutase [Clostridiales Family XIII bacterium]
MKYLILVPDGAADNIGEGENGKTPLEEAHMPAANGLAARGLTGLVRTIPDGIAPGSDAANLAVMGYDPVTNLTGRSPLEAVSIGIDMADTDVAFRTNLVTLAGDPDTAYEDRIIIDHSSGEITNEEAKELIEAVDRELGSGLAANKGRVAFYPGVSYRHALIVGVGDRTDTGIGDVSNEASGYKLTPPHDILERRIGDYLPQGEGSGFLRDFMIKSYDILKDHEINKDRVRRGLNPGNSIWIWGQGKKPALESFKKKFGIDGSIVSAQDLIKGIGICAGLEVITVPGATGMLDTNYTGKGAAAIEEFKKGRSFVYVHVEAPDECSHQGKRGEKIESLERIDAEILAPVLAWLRESGERFRILVVPDHPTPVSLRTHTAEPVPYVLFDSAEERDNGDGAFTEEAGIPGRLFDSGAELAEYFFTEI